LSLAWQGQDAHDHKGSDELDNLKEYETMYIIRPNLDEEAVDRSVAVIDEQIRSLGAVIESTDKKGRRRLAYEVDKMRDGYYVLTYFKCKPETVASITRAMVLSEDIIRSLIVERQEEPVSA
jgi:small subunit ribosomal protein S6